MARKPAGIDPESGPLQPSNSSNAGPTRQESYLTFEQTVLGGDGTTGLTVLLAARASPLLLLRLRRLQLFESRGGFYVTCRYGCDDYCELADNTMDSREVPRNFWCLNNVCVNDIAHSIYNFTNYLHNLYFANHNYQHLK
jgi:hypothetical protein